MDKEKKLYVGVNYHPHDWTKERWETDLRLMREAGFTVVRVGHLCWDSFEPSEGVYTFEWFDDFMDLCAASGMKVLLDISLRPAPVWVHELCPGCSIGGRNGDQQAALHRYMEDVTDPGYQHYAFRFAEIMANRYKEHSALLGFGLCNEQGAGFPSYSEASRQRFITWLRHKYGTIENLNCAWAARRWCRKLESFDQVPMQENEVTKGAPEAWLDMRRFMSDGINEFLIEFRKVVDAAAPGVPTTSNHYCEYETLGFDYLERCGEWVEYPGIGFYPTFHGDDPYALDYVETWYMKRLAQLKNPMWCIEFVSGGVGVQSSWYGLTRMYAYWTLMHRTQMILGWTWRSMLNGEEQFLYGLLDHDGTPNANYREYSQIAAEFEKLAPYGFPYMPAPRIALSYSYGSMLEAKYNAAHFRQRYDDNQAIVNHILEQHNLDYNTVSLETMEEGYSLLIVSGENMLSEKGAEVLRRFVEGGGTVIMTAYSATVDETGRVFDTPRPGRVADVFGIEIHEIRRTSRQFYPKEVECRIRRSPVTGHELLCIDDTDMLIDVDYYEVPSVRGAEVIHTAGGEKIPAVTRMRYGKGEAWYVFCEAEQRILDLVIGEVIQELKLSDVHVTPEGVIARRISDQATMYLNFSDSEKEIVLGESRRGVLDPQRRGRTLLLPAYDAELMVSEDICRDCVSD